ncbi:hypothetical protein K4K50_013151, partial [Colletotrichum sp. SAR 10_71]
MKSSFILSIAAIAAQVIALPTQTEERSVTLPVRDVEFAANIDVRPKLRRGQRAAVTDIEERDVAEDDET